MRNLFVICLLLCGLSVCYSQSYNANLHFDTDKDDLTEANRLKLDSIVNRLSELRTFQIRLTGHTDSHADSIYNLALSERRSNSVRSYLVSKGINSQCIVIGNFGEYSPVAPNITEEGCARNRRVEISISSPEWNPKTQIKLIDPTLDTEIYGSEGTVLFYEANSLVHSDGSPVSGEIALYVQEYYSMADILLSNLSTKSGDQLLETGGMLNIEAYSAGDKLVLAEGKELGIYFPFEQEVEDMQLFYGDWTNGHIDWTVDNSPIEFGTWNGNFSYCVRPDNVYQPNSIDYEEPLLPRWVRTLSALGVKRYEYKRRSEFARYVNLAENQNETQQKEIVNFWKKQRAEYVDLIMNTEYTKTEWDKVAEIWAAEQKQFIMAIKADTAKTHIQYTILDKTIELQNQMFRSAKLGWINCDRFTNTEEEKVDFAVKIPENDNTVVAIVFKDMKSVLYGTKTSGAVFFKDVPKGYEITVVGMRLGEGDSFLAMCDTKIDPEQNIELKYERVDSKTIVEKLNTLN